MEMIKNGIGVEFVNKHEIQFDNDNPLTGCAGYFCHHERQLKICFSKIKLEQWLGNYIHEYCHFLQWKMNSPKWTRCEELEQITDYDSWLSGDIEYNKRQLDTRTTSMQLMELEAEKWAVDIINKFKLPINTDTYIRKANVYILGYRIALDKRKWFTQSTSQPEVLKEAPNTFIKSVKNVPTKLYKTIEQYCFS